MRQWTRSHLTYANVIATLALFLVLSGGTAVALNGSNTVFSDDIVDDEVRSVDVRNDTLAGGGLGALDLKTSSVRASEIASNSVSTSDVAADSLAAGDLAPGSVGTSEAADDSLTGTDINESSLGEVPSATLGGLGGRPNSASFSCDPESTTFFSCGASAGVDLPAPSRVLIIGQIRAEPDTGGGNGGGSCRVSGMPSPAPVFVNGGQTDVMTVSGITDVLEPGTYSFNMVCNETASGIRYFDGNVNVVALSPDG
jgi:hypothetical protein